MAIFPKGKKLEQFQKDLAADTASGTAPTNVTAQAMAEHSRKMWEEYQRQFQGTTSGGTYQAKPTAERVIISTEEFMSMPIQSMEELMTVLTMRLRLTGTVLEEDGKLTVTIDQKSKEVTIEARNPIKPTWDVASVYQPNDFVQSMVNTYARVSSEITAQKVDAQILDILIQGGSPVIVQKNDPIEGVKISVHDEKKLTK